MAQTLSTPQCDSRRSCRYLTQVGSTAKDCRHQQGNGQGLPNQTAEEADRLSIDLTEQAQAAAGFRAASWTQDDPG